eukprot:scaffold12057_cov133-Isochrysis_galbana.AAC.1
MVSTSYILHIEGLPYKATQNTLGELTIGEALEVALDNIDPSPPTRWGGGVQRASTRELSPSRRIRARRGRNPQLSSPEVQNGTPRSFV